MPKIIDLDFLPYDEKKKSVLLKLEDLSMGVTVTDEFFVYRNAGEFKVYDRKCDHNGGKLCMVNDIIKCPLHGWEFDIEQGKYSNVQLSKETIDHTISDGTLSIEAVDYIPRLPHIDKDLSVKITFLAHASLLIETDNISFMMDPWITGFAFSGGWWPQNLPPKNWRKIINDVDFIYISHNHPDHLNTYTLDCVRRDMKFVVPNFLTGSVAKILRANGFTNILELSFQNHYQVENTQLFLTILKSGDFRDDSGLYFTYGNFSFLSSVDANDLNFERFPEDISLFASNFTGGASGYPLCFMNISETKKKTIIKRKNDSKKLRVRAHLRKCKAKYFLPYAGFFREQAKRDQYVLENNKKNTIGDYASTITGTHILNVEEHDEYVFNGDDVVERNIIARECKHEDDPEEFINKQINKYSFDREYLLEYFEECGFRDNLTVYISLTNDDFSLSFNKVAIDFSGHEVAVRFGEFDWHKIKNISDSGANPNNKYLYIEVRQDSFLWVVNRRMPWEELSIGFQCRIDRMPDIYNVEFWYHFTNIYVLQ